MFRRVFCALMVLCLLLGVFAVLPAFAGADRISDLSYTLAPTEEGGAVESGTVINKMIFYRTPTITWSTELWSVKVNGERETDGSITLDKAGEYEIELVSADAANAARSYSLMVWPDINLGYSTVTDNDTVFTSYPTLTCTNALSLTLDQGKEIEREITSGDTVTTLGSHTLAVGITSPTGAKELRYRFFIKACDAKRVYDAQSKKQGIEVTVGSFEDMTVEATLDGTPLAAGKHLVTAVGQHSLEVKINGTTVTDDFKVPTPEQLKLSVDLHLATLESEESIYLNLDGWDVTFLLDGKAVSGKYRITAHGEHTLTIADANGQPIKGALRVFVGESQEPLALDEVTLTFHNPHRAYAFLLLGVGAALLLFAIVFLVKRRMVV